MTPDSSAGDPSTSAPAPGGPTPPPPAHDAPLPPARVTNSGVRVLTGIPYADLPGVRPLELDLHLPPSTSPAPVVVFLHGGGWRLGSRRSLGPAYARVTPAPFEQLAAAGIAVASVDYRLSGERTWPAQLHDAKAAVRWLRARGAQAGIDPQRIAAWGESAGAQLALLLGLTGDADAELEGSVGVVEGSSAVSAVVAWYAPSDLSALPTDLGADPADSGTREALLLGGPQSLRPEAARQASPITYVRGGVPPTLLLHGRSDRLIPCGQSERLAARLGEAGVDVTLETYSGADHMWLGSTDVPRRALDRTLEFLQEVTKR